jgi:hypothetical protein
LLPKSIIATILHLNSPIHFSLKEAALLLIEYIYGNKNDHFLIFGKNKKFARDLIP